MRDAVRVKIYADRFPRFLSQVLTDLFVIAWVYVWIRGAMWLHDLVEKLAVPGQKLEGAGNGLADNLAEAGSKVGGVPLVGDELAAPFEKAADAARSMAEAGPPSRRWSATWRSRSAVLTAVLADPVRAPALAAAAGALDPPGQRGGAAPRRRRPAGTCWRCGRWPPSRWASWPSSTRTSPRPGGAPTTPRGRPGRARAQVPWPATTVIIATG